MKKWVLLLLLASPALAVTDPLASQFLPSIDTTPSDYYTALGTITVTDGLYKVWQSSTAPGTNRWITLYAFPNETQSFQVHTTPSVNVTSLTVTISSFTNYQNSAVISTTTSDLIAYREYYMHITTPTALSTWTYMGGARAWMPDQLIPVKEPYYGQTTNAFPIAVTAGNTQSAWFDVHVPSTTASGYFVAQAIVSSGVVVISRLPVILAVGAGWVMPSTATLGMIGGAFDYNGFCNVAYNGTTNCGNYPGAQGGADFANTLQWIDGAKQLLDNRYTTQYPSNIYPQTGSFATYVSSIGPMLNGTNAGQVNTILPGAALTGVQLENLSFSQSEWNNWASSFTAQGWFPRLFTYLCDEASGPTLTQCVSSMTVTRAWSTPPVPNQTTIKMADALTANATNYIDWMTPIIEDLEPLAGSLRSTYNTWLSTNSQNVGRKIGSYNDCESAGTCGNGTVGPANTPGYPNRHIDGQPVANRAMPTAAFALNLAYQLYFAIDYCDTQNCPTAITPWTSVYAFGCNGDGTLMYPSTPTIVTTSLNIPIWIPSIRIKEDRDGEQDYEYYVKLSSAGKTSTVNAQIATWYTNSYTYNPSPLPIQAAHQALFTAIHQLTFPPVTPTTPTESWSGKIKATANIKGL